MKTILLLLIFLVLGVFFGFILARMIYSISKFFTRKKIEKELKESPKKFFYKQREYDLNKEIEFQKSQRKKSVFSGFFKKKVKGGISQYGDSLQSGTIGEPIPTGSERIQQTEQSPRFEPRTNESTGTTEERRTTGKPEYSDSTEGRRESGRNFNRDLFKKSK